MSGSAPPAGWRGEQALPRFVTSTPKIRSGRGGPNTSECGALETSTGQATDGTQGGCPSTQDGEITREGQSDPATSVTPGAHRSASLQQPSRASPAGADWLQQGLGAVTRIVGQHTARARTPKAAVSRPTRAMATKRRIHTIPNPRPSRALGLRGPSRGRAMLRRGCRARHPAQRTSGTTSARQAFAQGLRRS